MRDRAAKASAGGRRTAALFVIDAGSSPGAYGRRSMMHQQMDLLGLENVFGSTGERYFDPSTEALVDAASDRVIALQPSNRGLAIRPPCGYCRG